MVKIAPGDTNIFNLTDAHLYRCQVHHYHNRLSRLYLRVYKAQIEAPAFYLLFSDVGYIEAPINWQGCGFNIAPAEACIQLLLDAGLIGQAILQFPHAYASLTEAARLYVMPRQPQPIRLIASAAAMLQRLPPELL